MRGLNYLAFDRALNFCENLQILFVNSLDGNLKGCQKKVSQLFLPQVMDKENKITK